MLTKYKTVDEIRAEITSEDEARWTKALEACADIPAAEKKLQFIKDLYFSGTWLGEKLSKAGCSDSEAESICFAHGQRCAFGNAWASAGRAWNAYVDGRPEHGGPELAVKILNEHIVVK
jgi:hypothetical protein